MSGHVADRSDLRQLLAWGMAASGLLTSLFGMVRRGNGWPCTSTGAPERFPLVLRRPAAGQGRLGSGGMCPSRALSHARGAELVARSVRVILTNAAPFLVELPFVCPFTAVPAARACDRPPTPRPLTTTRLQAYFWEIHSPAFFLTTMVRPGQRRLLPITSCLPRWLLRSIESGSPSCGCPFTRCQLASSVDPRRACAVYSKCHAA